MLFPLFCIPCISMNPQSSNEKWLTWFGLFVNWPTLLEIMWVEWELPDTMPNRRLFKSKWTKPSTKANKLLRLSYRILTTVLFTWHPLPSPIKQQLALWLFFVWLVLFFFNKYFYETVGEQPASLKSFMQNRCPYFLTSMIKMHQEKISHYNVNHPMSFSLLNLIFKTSVFQYGMSKAHCCGRQILPMLHEQGQLLPTARELSRGPRYSFAHTIESFSSYL